MKKIYFPALHKELLNEDILKEVTLINPGILEDNSMYYTPYDFPLKPKQAKKYINELLTYGDLFKSPKEIQQNFILQTIYEDKEKLSEIKNKIKNIEREREPNYYLIAQTTLLLQWTLEEKLLELCRIEEDIDKDMKKLKTVLGEEVSLDLKPDTKYPSVILNQISNFLPHEKLLPWFFLIMDREDILLTDVSELYEKWIDFDIKFIKLSNEEGKFQAKDKGYRFIFKKRPDNKRLWLDEIYTVEFYRR